jgi:hypothetical protein
VLVRDGARGVVNAIDRGHHVGGIDRDDDIAEYEPSAGGERSRHAAEELGLAASVEMMHREHGDD